MNIRIDNKTVPFVPVHNRKQEDAGEAKTLDGKEASAAAELEIRRENASAARSSALDPSGAANVASQLRKQILNFPGAALSAQASNLNPRSVADLLN